MADARVITKLGGVFTLLSAHLVGLDHIAHNGGIYEICDGDKIDFISGDDN